MPHFRAKTKTKNQRRWVEEKGEERWKQKFPSQRTLKFHYIVQEYSSEEVTGDDLELSSGSQKNNFKCLNNNNKTTGGAYRNSMVTALQKKGRRLSLTTESTHLSTTLRTHTHLVCRALEHWANFQLTSDLNCYLPLLNHLPFTTRPRVSPAYIINKPKELQQADLSVEARHKHRLTIIGREKN